MQRRKRRLFALLALGALTVPLFGCGGGSSSGGAGSGVVASRDGDGGLQTGTSSPTDVSVTESSTPVSSGGDDVFHLIFEQTNQPCDSCGIWFRTATLKIEHSTGTFEASQSGSLLIKQSPYRQGVFQANLGSIPASSQIQSATLYMTLDSHEGIANEDHSSVIAVYGFVNGNLQFVREISAAYDIKGLGYSKGGNPVVPFDFTDYARLVN